jgi:hypothetical protein
MKIHKIFNMGLGSNKCTPSKELPIHCLVGVEHELEGASGRHYDASFDDWKAVSDGSLRGGGIEYVLKEPLAGEELVNSLKILDEYVGKQTNIHKNDRTSTHVHIDARDMTVDQLILFIVLYMVYEQAIFSLCDASRIENNFCIPVRKNGGVIRRLKSLVNNKDNASILHDLADNHYRYASMNLASLQRFGSIEFRMRETLTSAEPLLEWINIFLSMKKFAVAQSGDGIETFFERFVSAGPAMATKLIFGTDLTSILGSRCDLAATTWEGCSLARHVFSNEERNLQMIAANFDKVNPWEDRIVKLGAKVGVNTDHVVNTLQMNPDSLYDYPPFTHEEIILQIKREILDWWADHMPRELPLATRRVSISQFEDMRSLIAMHGSSSLDYSQLLTPSSARKYVEYHTNRNTPAYSVASAPTPRPATSFVSTNDYAVDLAAPSPWHSNS